LVHALPNIHDDAPSRDTDDVYIRHHGNIPL
jgi:hypothetical protein